MSQVWFFIPRFYSSLKYATATSSCVISNSKFAAVMSFFFRRLYNLWSWYGVVKYVKKQTPWRPRVFQSWSPCENVYAIYLSVFIGETKCSIATWLCLCHSKNISHQTDTGYCKNPCSMWLSLVNRKGTSVRPPISLCWMYSSVGARGSVVGWGSILQARRSRVRWGHWIFQLT
jgi:hypothetical protein